MAISKYTQGIHFRDDELSDIAEQAREAGFERLEDYLAFLHRHYGPIVSRVSAKDFRERAAAGIPQVAFRTKKGVIYKGDSGVTLGSGV